MTVSQPFRQLVLDRLGTPAALLPGESYHHDDAVLEYIYARYVVFIDEALLEGRPERALESYLVFLEAERERDYEAFHYGRELLLEDLHVHVQHPRTDAEPEPRPMDPVASVVRERSPRWSRRKPARDRGRRVDAEQLRARVLARLGWPHGFVPGECAVLTGSDALSEITGFFDQFDYRPITAPLVDEAIERVAGLRERDWDAFCHGRTALLGLLPIKIGLCMQAGG